MLKPNIGRVIVKPIKEQPLSSSGLIIGGQLKAGENLFVGIVQAIPDKQGASESIELKVGQIVYYSEYSASVIVDMGQVFAGKMDFMKAQREENMNVVVSIDDIMGYETEDIDVETFLSETKEKKSAKPPIALS